jgi:predicted amidohydrolase
MIKRKLKVLIGQINPIVGDLDYNKEKIVQIIKSNQNVDYFFLIII